MKMKRTLAFADQNSLLRHSDSGGCRIAGIGDEYALPDGCALRALHVVDVQHHFRKAFVENTRLNLKRHLRSLQLVLQPGQRFLRTRSEIDAIGECKQPNRDKENRENAEKRPYADTTRLHSSNFAVGGETNESNQDSNQRSRG